MRDNVMAHATAGILGGALGTALLRQGMKASEKLPLRLQPTHSRTDPGEFMVMKLEQFRGKPLPRTVRDVVVQGLHWGYGMTSGLVLGVATSRRHIPTVPSALLAGAVMGAGVWAVGYAGWLPATKLTPPLTQQGGRHIAVSLLGHVAFGIVAVAPILLMDRRSHRPLWKRALRQLLR
jgi:hypothetical protein